MSNKNLAIIFGIGLCGAAMQPAVFAASLDALSARELNQIRTDAERLRRSEELRTMQERQRQSDQAPTAQAPSPAPSGNFLFKLKKLAHTETSVLTEAEWQETTSPWIGKDVTAAEITELLKAVNGLYRKKGYVVCLAVVRPQKVTEGELTVTLIEGKTERVTVDGAKSTSESYYRGALPLKEGEVANYREMLDDLIRFNMTNDAQMAIDIHPGETVGTSSYGVTVAEPDRWGASVFADTNGARSTGRPRVGASLVNRSVFGWRDSAWLVGVASQGSKSISGGYSVPLTRYGTRLSVTASAGDVKVVGGESRHNDVTGDSTLLAARLEHPVFVTNSTKTTLFVERSRQTSKTDIFDDVRISDLVINAWTGGAEWYCSLDRVGISLTAQVSDRKAHQKASYARSRYRLASGTVSVAANVSDSVTTSVAGSWQAKLSGDTPVSSDYLGLGTSGGVRGYDNDSISAENGFWLNWETTWWHDVGAPQRAGLFGFVDAGRLSGYNPYAASSIASVGGGVIWPLFKGANLRATASFPLRRGLGDDVHVNRARADLSVAWSW